MGSNRRGSTWCALAVLAAIVLGGCTTTVTGTAAPVAGGETRPSATPTPTPIAVVPPPRPTEGSGVEARRLAGVTSLVKTVFPDRTDGCLTGPLTSADLIDSVYFTSRTVAPVLDRYGFVAAWAQCRQGPDGRSTTALTMEVSDPASAQRAAREMTDAVARPTDRRVQVSSASAIVHADGEHETVRAWTSVGRIVVYTADEAAAGQGVAETDRLLADQVALLASFTPTPQQQVPDLPVDPYGLASLAVTPPGLRSELSGSYDLESYLRLALDPAQQRAALSANGFAGMYGKYSSEPTTPFRYQVSLWTFPTSQQTNAVYRTFAENEKAALRGRPFQLPAIPDAPCFVFEQTPGGNASFYQRCYVGYGKYLASIDVAGLPHADDFGAMSNLLTRQRDLIDG